MSESTSEAPLARDPEAGTPMGQLRRAVRAQAIQAEAKSSIALMAVVVGLTALLLLGAVLRHDQPDRMVSAAMLQGLLLQIACITLQVAWGRLEQARGSEPSVDGGGDGGPQQPPPNGRRRALGWTLPFVPALLAFAFLLSLGLSWRRAGIGAYLTTSSVWRMWVGLYVLELFTVAAAILAIRKARSTIERCQSVLGDVQRLEGASPDVKGGGKARRSEVEPGTGPALAITNTPRTSDRTWTSDQPSDDARARFALAFSGGGIRSASFCLGGFNTIQRYPERINDLDAMVSVSGGSYAAAAINITRTFDANGEPNATEPIPLDEVYAVDSPELAYLRRNSRYLYQPAWRLASGLWQLVGGAILHVLLAIAAIRYASWLLGWFIGQAGIATRLDTDRPEFLSGSWPYVVLAIAPWALALVYLALLLIKQSIRRGEQGTRPGDNPSTVPWARHVSNAGRVFFGSLLALAVVPLLFVGLGRVAYDGGTPTALSGVIVDVGLTTESGCYEALVDSAEGAHHRLLEAATVEATHRSASYGACGFSGTLSLPDQPECGQCAPGTGTPATFDADQAARAAAGGAVGPNGLVSGSALHRLFAVIVALGTSLALIARALVSLPKLTGRRYAKVARAVLLRVPLVAVSLVGFVVGLVWTFHYATGTASGGQVWPYALILVAIVGQLVNPNTTSLHEFYRERLASAFSVGRNPRSDVAPGRSAPWSGDSADQLSVASGRPYSMTLLAQPPELVLCATANVNDQRYVPTRRFGVPLTFSPERVRLEAAAVSRIEAAEQDNVGYRKTALLQQDTPWRSLTTMSAVAMSGAAVSPLMGRTGAKVAPFRLLLTLFNIRLGVWVKNPRWPLGERPAPWWAPMSTNPRLHQLFREAFGSTAVNDRWLYVTDGGHLDNLGMVEAVRRLPNKLLVLSASNDPAGTWQDVGAAVSVVRADLGIDLKESARDYQDSWMRLSGSFGDDQTIDILVVRATLVDADLARERSTAEIVETQPPESAKPPGPGAQPSTVPSAPGRDGEGSRTPATVVEHQQAVRDVAYPMPVDVSAFATRDGTFPRASTGRQDFGDLEFESYRTLGQYLVDRALAQQNPAF